MSTKGQTMKKLLLALLVGYSMSVSASYAKDTTKDTTKDTPQYTSLDIKEMVTIYAERHKVPFDLAHAVIYVESKYNPKVMGQHGEYGLGQIRCGTAKQMGFNGKCDDLHDPKNNLEFSMAYLRYALDLTNNDVCKAASYYGSGIVPISNKTAYCRKILDHLN
jgi:soluble lytic murein transglycosylase-like protein